MTTDDIIINNLEAIIASQHQTIAHMIDLYNAIPESDDSDTMSQAEFDLADARDTILKQAACIRELMKDKEALDHQIEVHEATIERIGGNNDQLKRDFLAANRCLMSSIDEVGSLKRECESLRGRIFGYEADMAGMSNQLDAYRETVASLIPEPPL